MEPALNYFSSHQRAETNLPLQETQVFVTIRVDVRRAMSDRRGMICRNRPHHVPEAPVLLVNLPHAGYVPQAISQHIHAIVA